MRFSTTLCIALCLVVSTSAYPIEYRTNHQSVGKTGTTGTSKTGTTGTSKTGTTGTSKTGTTGTSKTGTSSGTGTTSGTKVDSSVRDTVNAAIKEWLDDIKVVNHFVDNVVKLTNLADISALAQATLGPAKNQGVALSTIENSVKLSGSALAAANALPAQFKIVGPGIQDTMNDPKNMKTYVGNINAARCQGGAIDQEGAVMQAAAFLVDSTATEPDKPSACG